jgi:hypothetical protein
MSGFGCLRQAGLLEFPEVDAYGLLELPRPILSKDWVYCPRNSDSVGVVAVATPSMGSKPDERLPGRRPAFKQGGCLEFDQLKCPLTWMERGGACADSFLGI